MVKSKQISKWLHRVSNRFKEMSEYKAVNFEIFGKVQGVYFRKYTKENAKKLGLTGYVQNTNRGTVIGLLEGKSQAVERMKEWLSKQGSPKSKIDHATFGPERTIKNNSYNNFEIIRFD